MDEIEEENDETSSIIKHASKSPISNNPSQQSESQSFNITPKELTNLMNLYKDRSGNYNDIKYFQEKGGILPLLLSLKTDAKHGISTLSLENRKSHFGSNKIYIKPPPKFADFCIEAISDKMIIILIIS